MNLRLVALIAALTTPAIAEPVRVGVAAGPRVFSDDSRLGYRSEERGHPSLETNVQVSARVAYAILPWRWIVPELELAFARTTTTPEAEAPRKDASWLEPRLHVRFELLPDGRVHPFLVVGGGVPIVLAPSNYTMQSGVTGEGYAGAGVRVDLAKSFALRLDARVGGHPGIEYYVTGEYEVGLGLEYAITRSTHVATTATVAKAVDKCPDRDEDMDGFEDEDGCPDIDNDFDGVLDIADSCRDKTETYNGVDDIDGCPDELPAELATLKGPIPGLLFAEKDPEFADNAAETFAKIAAALTAHPRVKLVIIGFTDGAEPALLAADGGDADELAEALGRARAENVAQALVDAGASRGQLVVEGRGGDQPLGPDTTPRERLTNRRVEIKLFVAPH